MDPPDPIHFPDAPAWRKWLAENHDRQEGLWLLFYKRHADRPGLAYPDAVDEAIAFGWIDGQLKRIDDVKHMIKFTPRRKGSVWSKINKDKAERLIKTGRMTAAGLARIEEAKKSGLWDAAYTNKKKERMPSDLKAALVQDKIAWENFRKFANSYRNMYIGWVKGAKTEETRKRRIKEVVARSLKNKKPGIE
jgi:uncharacterized protein YdeI (YjbR/CyaY-like superfamily)